MSENRILTELPKKGKSFYYEKMVGMELELLYNDEIYKVEIVDYIKGKNAKFKIKYNGLEGETGCCNFVKKNKFGGILKKRTSDFKVDIGKVFDDIVITDREYRVKDRINKGKLYGYNEKWYKYKCGKCKYLNGDNYESWIEENALLKGGRCNCCASKVVVEDINSIWATDRWMCDLGLSEKDAKTHTKGSHDSVVVICSDCGKQKEIRIATLYKYGLGCICGDGFSYPEKFMSNVLNQLEIDYKYQYQPKYLKRLEEDGNWSQKKSDFYLERYGLIVETDGRLGHKGGFVHGYSKKPLEYYIEVDNWKDEQHLLHGLKTIRINCFESNMEYIKNSILNSELNKLFDLSKIDWVKCDKDAQKSLVIEVCNYWNNKKDWETTKHLAKYFKLDISTIRDYLNRGVELGLCGYNGKEEMKKRSIN